MSLDDLEFAVQRMTAGSVSVGDWETLAYFARDRELVVELGTNLGTTTIMLAAIAQRVVTIDVFEKTDLIVDEVQRKAYVESMKHNCHTFGNIERKLAHYRNIEVVQSLTVPAAERFPDNSIDMLFIDADHSEKGVEGDYEAYYPKVKKGGRFVFHDCLPKYPVFKFYVQKLLVDRRIAAEEYVAVGISSMVVFRKVNEL